VIINSLTQLLPAKTDRAFLCGMTGSGKSFLARYLCAYSPSVLIFDAKDEITWKGYQRFTKLAKLIEAKPRFGIYAPCDKELLDPKFWDFFFKYAYKRKNTTVLVDEVLAVCEGNDLPFHYKAILTRGRSLGVRIFSNTQRPKSIPTWIISEAEHKYIFFLQMPQDRERIAALLGIDESIVFGLDKEAHEFIYANLKGSTGKLALNVQKGIIQ
jgi:hypothetical protein